MAASKKGVQRSPAHRSLGVTYKTAWFMATVSAKPCGTGGLAPLGRRGHDRGGRRDLLSATSKSRSRRPQRKGRPFIKSGAAPGDKRPVVALVERGGVRTFTSGVADKATIDKIVRENIAARARLTPTKAASTSRSAWQFATTKR